MTQAIEQLIKIHDAQTVSIESMGAGRGKGRLSREQMIGAFACAQRRHPVGFSVLMAKYKGDEVAEARVRHSVESWCQQSGMSTKSTACCMMAISVVLGRTMPSQRRHIASLIRRHSRHGMSTKRLIETYTASIKQMRRSGGDPEYIEMQQQRIIELNAGLKLWAEMQAAIATVCPRCSGTGALKNESACVECDGSGAISSSVDHIEPSLRMAGIKIKKEEWQQDCLPAVMVVISWLRRSESEASDVITARIREEIRGVA